MSLIFCGFSPHPPLLVPDIGRENIKEVEKTQEALREMAKMVKEKNPEAIVMITPHGPILPDAICIECPAVIKGSFANFGVPHISAALNVDTKLAKDIADRAEEMGVSAILMDQNNADKFHVPLYLDHALLVPLYYLGEAGLSVPIVPVTMAFLSYPELYEFGKALDKAISASGKRIAVIASGDLSHRLIKSAPAGYDPMGKVFDEKIIKSLEKFDVKSILNLDEALIERAGECGLRPLIMMLGALHSAKVASKVLSYEGPFGVGYAVAAFEPQ